MRNAIRLKTDALMRIMTLLAVFASAAQAVELHYLTLYARRAPHTAALRDKYLQLVRSRIEENRHYPLIAWKLGQEGKVPVRFIVAADGSLKEVELEKSCGNRSLDEAARAAVRAAAPFPSPPDEVFPDTTTMRIVIVFALR